LAIQVTGTAPPSKKVTINGRPTRREGPQFVGETVLSGKVTKIVAEAEGCPEARTRVVWDKFSEPRYRFALDDNIFFLRDIGPKEIPIAVRLLLPETPPCLGAFV
jgi:hypothetical protein